MFYIVLKSTNQTVYKAGSLCILQVLGNTIMTYLPPDSEEAMICSFECTFCRKCVEEKLKGRCPNCGGNFVSRPIRSAELLIKNP